MTSVPNRRLRSSGNKLLLAALVLLIAYACSGPKKVVHHPPSTPPPPKTEQVEIYDPVTGTNILVPKSSVHVDTVKWTTDVNSPLVTDKPEEPIKPVRKNSYAISLLMPFDAADPGSQNFDGKISRFLQYYAGVRLAMQEVDSLGYKIKLHTFDVDGSVTGTKSLTEDPEFKKSDVIIGPYEKDGIEVAAQYGKAHETPVISPWLPAFSVNEENPYFIQANPGLASHAEAIMNYIAVTWPNKKIFLVARDNAGEISRLGLFKKNSSLHPEDLVIKDASPDLASTDLKSKFSPDGTIFIMPYFQKTDESFVNSFLRKLHADKLEDDDVIVFGMPQWMGFANLNSNYIESLSLHLSAATFLDTNQPDYQSFKERFFSQYHVVPDLQAFLGYDMMRWIAFSLISKGKNGMIEPGSAWDKGLATGFEIRPVFRTNGTTNTDKSPMYYENARIRILKYEGQDFHLVQ